MEQYTNNIEIDKLMEGFQVISHDWCYLYVNEAVAKHTKMSKSELLGFRITEVFPDIEQTVLFKKLQECMLHRISNHIETELKFRDGRIRWYDLRIKPIPEGICVLTHDITNRKKAFSGIFKPSSIFEEKLGYRTKELLSKNKNHQDSLRYAKKIQNSYLQPKSKIYKSFPKSLLLFKPKDEVSGDFYWCKELGDKILFAIGDCTGHGVPGALLSMVGIEKLKKLTLTYHNASELLGELNKIIKFELNKKYSEKLKDINFNCNEKIEEYCNDGMDIAFCCLDKTNSILTFAGANRPLWLIRDLDIELIDIKGTRCGIGGYTNNDQYFESHEIKLEKGDTFYIFSDGYADTFGGPNGKKFKTKNFKYLLLEIQDKTMKQQELYLDNFIENWKTGYNQIDDIVVLGVRM